jgi:hypothetical protein
MARKQTRPSATQYVVLEPYQITCRVCGSRMQTGIAEARCARLAACGRRRSQSHHFRFSR